MNSLILSPEVQALIDLANQIAPLDRVDQLDPKWHNAISAASPDALVGLVSLLSSGRGTTSRARKAMREAAMAESERKNAKAIIQTLHSLDSATSALNKRMLWLTAAGVLFAIAQLIFAIAPFLGGLRR